MLRDRNIWRHFLENHAKCDAPFPQKITLKSREIMAWIIAVPDYAMKKAKSFPGITILVT